MFLHTNRSGSCKYLLIIQFHASVCQPITTYTGIQRVWDAVHITNQFRRIQHWLMKSFIDTVSTWPMLHMSISIFMPGSIIYHSGNVLWHKRWQVCNHEPHVCNWDYIYIFMYTQYNHIYNTYLDPLCSITGMSETWMVQLYTHVESKHFLSIHCCKCSGWETYTDHSDRVVSRWLEYNK